MFGKKVLMTAFASLGLSTVMVPVSQAAPVVQEDAVIERFKEWMCTEEDRRKTAIGMVYDTEDNKEISEISKRFVVSEERSFEIIYKNFMDELKQNEKMQKNYKLFLELVERFGDTGGATRRHTCSAIRGL